MLRAESKKVASLKREEYVALNCIYLSTFTAMDQLSIDKFDVEHIVPKEQMRRIIEDCQGEGLPVSSIANLCYLPEYANRSKKDRNFYQDKKYLQKIDLQEVEEKYSFTDVEDLEWMDISYEKMEDFKVLKEYYTDYCTKRFEKMKLMFCDSLKIEYEEADTQVDLLKEIVVPKQDEITAGKKVKFADKCIIKLAKVMKEEIIKAGRSVYTTKDNSEGFVITTSKMYAQGNREKYWFAYRKNQLKDIEMCKQQYVIYGCKDESTMIKLLIGIWCFLKTTKAR